MTSISTSRDCDLHDVVFVLTPFYNNARKKPSILEPSIVCLLQLLTAFTREIEVARKNYRSGKEIRKLRHGRN